MKSKIRFIGVFLFLLIFFNACAPSNVSTLNAQSNTVVSQNLESNLSKWGLGTSLIVSISNNRNYEWYLDQEFTGTYAGENCGPTSVTMAAKWWDQTTPLTPEKARSKYQSGGGWWYTDDIEATLKDYKVPYQIEYDFTVNQMKAHLLKGKILIMCANMSYIPKNDKKDQRTGRYYEYADGHFFIIKGYTVTEKGSFFEVYDPNNWSLSYEDGSPMGKGRFYHEDALLDSIRNWWYGMFVIGK